MVKNGNITLIGEIRGLKPARLVSDPQEGDLREGLVWVNTTEKSLRWFDGAVVHTLAHGGNLDEYLNLAGGTMTGPLVLAGVATEPNHPTTLGQVEELLAEKQDNIEGAASTILTENLETSVVVVSDAQGKVSSSEITVAELNHLDGVESNVQEQINSKQANLGYAPVDRAGDNMTGDLVFDGNHTVTGLRAPAQPTDAVRLIDIDNLKADLDFQADVLYVQTDGLLQAEESYDLPDHQVRIVVTDIATLSETFGTIEGLGNGDIIVKNGEQWEIAYDVSEKGPGVLVWARDLEKFIKFDGTQWNEHGGLSGVTATGGLSKEGNTIRVETGAGVTLLPAGYVGLSLRSTSPLRLVDPTSGEASVEANAVLDINHDASMSRTDGVLRVANAGVRAAHLNEDIVGFGLTGAEGSALSIKLDGTTLEVDESGLRLGDVSDQYLHFETGGTVTGELHVAESTADTHAVQKVYVDNIRQNLNTSLNALTQRFTDSLFIFDGLGEVAASAYTIEHNLGTRGVTVAVYDEDYHQIVPDGIELATPNSVVVTLAQPQRVYVVIHGVKAVAPNPVTSVSLPTGGDVVLAEGESYKFSVQYAGTGVGFLEMDINVTNPALPELARTQYTLRADAADPYNGAAADFAAQGVTVTYNEANKRWDIDFGLSITEALVNSGTVRLYSVLRDANGNRLWGDMNNVTPEMRVTVNLSRA